MNCPKCGSSRHTEEKDCPLSHAREPDTLSPAQVAAELAQLREELASEKKKRDDVEARCTELAGALKGALDELAQLKAPVENKPSEWP